MISDLLCSVAVKKGFICDKTLRVVLRGGFPSVIKVSLRPGPYTILGQGRVLLLVLSVPCFIIRQELSLLFYKECSGKSLEGISDIFIILGP